MNLIELDYLFVNVDLLSTTLNFSLPVLFQRKLHSCAGEFSARTEASWRLFPLYSALLIAPYDPIAYFCALRPLSCIRPPIGRTKLY